MHYKMTIAAEGLVTIASSIGFGAAFASVGASERTGMATNPLSAGISNLHESSCERAEAHAPACPWR